METFFMTQRFNNGLIYAASLLFWRLVIGSRQVWTWLYRTALMFWSCCEFSKLSKVNTFKNNADRNWNCEKCYIILAKYSEHNRGFLCQDKFTLDGFMSLLDVKLSTACPSRIHHFEGTKLLLSKVFSINRFLSANKLEKIPCRAFININPQVNYRLWKPHILWVLDVMVRLRLLLGPY